MDPQEIIKKFIDNNYKPMTNIPNNRIFYTEVSASTLVWVEDRVVIEHYFLFPNLITPMHKHPFENQVIFIKGDFIAYRKTPSNFIHPDFEPDKLYEVKLTPKHAHRPSSIMPIGVDHGFTVGPAGAEVYNIQIWPNSVTNPSSATIEFIGDPIGPIHSTLIENVTQLSH